MDDEQGLLAAVWDRPHDDLPRLVYADYLDETGDPANVARAEFIRVQCELATLDEDDRQHTELEARQNRLWKAHAKAWKAKLPRLLHPSGFSRGFPAPRLRQATVQKFLALPAEELAAAPLWSFHLAPNARKLNDLLGCPHLLRVSTLNFRHWLETLDAVRRFVASPNVRNLSDIDLGWSNFGDLGVEQLIADSDHLPALRSLNLEVNDLTDRAVVDIADPMKCRELRHLNLSMNRQITAAGIHILFKPAVAPELRHLNLDANGLTDAAAFCIAQSNPTFRLRRLWLSDSRFTDAGVDALAAWPGLASVRQLKLDCYPKLSNDGLMALIKSPHLSAVRSLILLNSDADWQVKEIATERFGSAIHFTGATAWL